MALYAYRTGFPSCCACTIMTGLNGSGSGTGVGEGKDHLYIDILTQAQKDAYGQELEEKGYECIKVFQGSHGNYNLYLYASPRPDKDGKINNPGRQPSIKLPPSKTPIRDKRGCFKRRLTWEN